MNDCDTLINIYGRLMEREWMPRHIYSPLRRILRRVIWHKLNNIFASVPIDLRRPVDDRIIVSLTSFPPRIETVYFVIQSMLRQTILPMKVFLWLSNEQFRDKSDLPSSLLGLENDVFEIVMVNDDFRSHKKYYYAAKEYPSKRVVVVDDDLIYPSTLLEELSRAYDKNGGLICRYGAIISRDAQGRMLPYKQWTQMYDECSGNDIFFGSGGGTLFCPADYCSELTDIESALTLTPFADDVWLNAMTRRSHIKISLLKNGLIAPLEIKNNETLFQHNVEEDMNDVQIRRIIERYHAEDFIFR